MISNAYSPLSHQIAVHCHAGYGRTGIAIAAILISLRGMTGLEVINLIRQKRFVFG